MASTSVVDKQPVTQSAYLICINSHPTKLGQEDGISCENNRAKGEGGGDEVTAFYVKPSFSGPYDGYTNTFANIIGDPCTIRSKAPGSNRKNFTLIALLLSGFRKKNA